MDRSRLCDIKWWKFKFPLKACVQSLKQKFIRAHYKIFSEDIAGSFSCLPIYCQISPPSGQKVMGDEDINYSNSQNYSINLYFHNFVLILSVPITNI